MKTIGVLGVAALVGLAGCASADMQASSHCDANVSTRVLASDCEARAQTRTGRPLYKAQQRNTAVDGSLRQ